jgi:hypothetical protein
MIGDLEMYIVKILIMLIVLCTTMLLLIVPFIFFYRFLRIKKQNKVNRLMKIYNDQLIRLIEENRVEKTFIKVPSSHLENQAIVSVMCRLFTIVDTSNQKKIRELYKKLDLHYYSSNKFLSKKWTTQVEGIFEIGQLGIRGFNTFIERFLDSKNRIVRSEARIALIKLLPYVPFAFLDSLQRSFTQWEQIIVYQLLEERKIEIPQFSLWLNSPNDTVILFSLQMIIKFNQIDGVERIYLLRNHYDERVRSMVERCLTNIDRINREATNTLELTKRIC